MESMLLAPWNSAISLTTFLSVAIETSDPLRRPTDGAIYHDQGAWYIVSTVLLTASKQ